LIKKLRRKFIAVIMAVVTVLMIAAFVSVLIYNYRNMLRQAEFTLDNTLKSMSAPESDKPGDRRVPALTVVADENGHIISAGNQIFNLSDDDIPDIVGQALDTGDDRGVIRDYSLRFQLQVMPSGETHLVFVDISTEKNVTENLLMSSALIGFLTLIVFFGVSILLAHWIVRPVEKAWNSQRQFVADASHELKTPLTVVLSNVEILSDDELIRDEKTRLRLENILEEAKRMRVLVDDMLQLARSDNAHWTVAFEKVDFSALVSSAVLVFEPMAFDAGKRIDYDLEDGLFVTGDPIRLRQLTEIILDNACKYATPKGRIDVSLKKVAGRNEICLLVTNDSEPIPEEELALIFERFYRRDKSRSGGGYGLGLSIADNVVRSHGGRISAESADGRTTFSVLLPAAR
jgi:signal transduction histidine kinase